jgi:hypothetical protein
MESSTGAAVDLSGRTKWLIGIDFALVLLAVVIGVVVGVTTSQSAAATTKFKTIIHSTTDGP